MEIKTLAGRHDALSSFQAAATPKRGPTRKEPAAKKEKGFSGILTEKMSPRSKILEEAL